ncbi:MAG: hypothetical protein E6G22_11975 [Actinobacteria bacterium]|nr:MAG: hypothetical protein E6G22_11975 [Actinomycetota bacterium]
MRPRLPLLLSLTALVVAVFAPQSIGNAALQAGGSVVKHALFADRAHYARFARDAVHATKADRAGKAAKAKSADFAQNAGAVNTIQASRTPTPNMLLPLDANGKLPSSIGAVGPAGPPGPIGVSAEQLVTADSSTNSNTVKSQSVSCPSGKKVVGGGAAVNTTSNSLAITRSSPAGDLSGWTAEAQETSAFAGNWRVTVYAVCARVAA